MKETTGDWDCGHQTDTQQEISQQVSNATVKLSWNVATISCRLSAPQTNHTRVSLGPDSLIGSLTARHWNGRAALELLNYFYLQLLTTTISIYLCFYPSHAGLHSSSKKQQNELAMKMRKQSINKYHLTLQSCLHQSLVKVPRKQGPHSWNFLGKS